MKKTKVLESFILSIAILASCFSTLGISAATADESEAITALKAAWADLTEKKTELLAIPAAAQRIETATATGLTDEEKAAFGDYYYYNADGAKYAYTYPLGQSGFKDYSSKSNVRYSFYVKVVNMTTNFEMKFYDTSWSGRSSWPYCEQNKLTHITLNASNVGGADIRKINAIEILNPNKAEMYLGCIYVSYEEPVALPENCNSFTTADQWAEAVSKLDLANITASDSFKAAFAELQKYTTDYEAIEAFKTQYTALTKNITELLAIPAAAQRKETATATDLTDEEKAAFGDYYYYNADGAKYAYTYPLGQSGFKDYSSKSNVRYSFYVKVVNMTTNFEMKFYDTSWSGRSSWPYCEQNKLTHITLNASNVGGADIRKINAIEILNPNKAEMYLGCIYVSYEEPVDLPANYEFFTAEDWLNTVYSTDFTGYNVTDEFKAAFKALENCTEEGKKLSALKEAYGNLKNTTTELFAIPHTKFRYSTAELSDEEKAAFGEYYYYYNAVADHIYTYPDGQTGYKDYSGLSNVKYSFSAKITNKTTSFCVKMTSNYSDWGAVWPTCTQNELMSFKFSADNFGGFDLRKIVALQINNANSAELYLGCIYASYDEMITTPLNYELFSAEKLTNAIYNTNLSDYDLTEEFKNAFNAIKTVSELARADVNADYVFNSEDLAVLRQVLLGVRNDYDGDVSGNGNTDILDLVKIKKMLVTVE